MSSGSRVTLSTVPHPRISVFLRRFRASGQVSGILRVVESPRIDDPGSPRGKGRVDSGPRGKVFGRLGGRHPSHGASLSDGWSLTFLAGSPRLACDPMLPTAYPFDRKG